ncbi:MAG: hypothetical protein AAGE52_23985 [Myxococcota bacterium]
MGLLRAGSLALIGATCLACLVDDGDGPDPLGELHGSFTITGTLDENECAGAVPALSPISFDVELRRLEQTAVWRRSGAPVTYGTIDDGEWEISTTVVQTVFDPDPITGHPGCSFTQQEIVVLREGDAEADAGNAADATVADAAVADAAVADAAVDAAVADAAVDAAAVADAGLPTNDAGAPDGGVVLRPMDGEMIIRFTPTTGSDCSSTLAAFGGPFPMLPCSVRYELAGQPQ